MMTRRLDQQGLTPDAVTERSKLTGYSMSLKSALQVLFAAVAVTALMICSSSAVEPQTLQVLCYNIHYSQGTDGKYDIERIAQASLKAKPDLVALWEVDVDMQRRWRVLKARRLVEMMGMAVRSRPTPHYQRGLFRNAVLTIL